MRHACTAALVMLLAMPAWADFRHAAEAYQRGDYAAALEEWQPMAEHGNSSAQFNLGVMYHNGEGLPQDDVQALMWWTLAASRGHDFTRHLRDVTALEMTDAEVDEADRLAADWLDARM